MKVLFICQANVGRSQAAMSLYNQMHPGQSESAGTIVDNPGEELMSRKGAKNIIKIMSENGINIAHNTRNQISENMIDQYDKLIVMAEPETVPDWLKNNSKTEIWTIQDAKGQDLRTTRRIVNQIKAKIKAL